MFRFFPIQATTYRIGHRLTMLLGIVKARSGNNVINTNVFRMTRMTGLNCAVMRNLINTHTHAHFQTPTIYYSTSSHNCLY